MKFFVVLLVILFLSCKSSQKNGIEDERFSGYRLPTEKEINIDYKIYRQDFTYYFSSKNSSNNSDTSKFIPCRIFGYDKNDKGIESIYNWYESIVPCTMVSLYDSAGKEIVQYSKNDDSSQTDRASKILYYYDDIGRLSKSVSFDFEKRIRKDVDKGLGRPGGCIIYPEDYEKHKSWKILSIWNNKYDETGKLIEEFASIANSNQNRYTYKYDTNGRLIEKRSLDNNELVWIESYIYYDRGHEYTRTWYVKGQREKDPKSVFYPVDTFRYKTDKHGNETDELVIEQGGRQISREKKYYDSENRIMRHETYDSENKLLGFYLHKYSVRINPIEKKFFVSN